VLRLTLTLLVFRDDFDDTDVVNCLAEKEVSKKIPAHSETRCNKMQQGVFKPDSSTGSTETDYFKTMLPDHKVNVCMTQTNRHECQVIPKCGRQLI
jgi:hypothetical protein